MPTIPVKRQKHKWQLAADLFEWFLNEIWPDKRKSWLSDKTIRGKIKGWGWRRSWWWSCWSRAWPRRNPLSCFSSTRLSVGIAPQPPLRLNTANIELESVSIFNFSHPVKIRWQELMRLWWVFCSNQTICVPWVHEHNFWGINFSSLKAAVNWSVDRMIQRGQVENNSIGEWELGLFHLHQEHCCIRLSVGYWHWHY